MDATEQQAAGSYLDSVVPHLWPAPLRVTHVRRRRPGDDGTREFLLVPSARNPRLVVPAGSALASSAAVRNYNTGSTARGRATSNALALAARVGLAQLLFPDRLSVAASGGAATDIEQHLCDVLARPVRISLYIGPARSVRKPVLQVIDARGRTIAFAKLGVDDFTRALVRAEADAVREVSTRRFSTLTVPQALYRGEWNANPLLVQQAMARGVTAAPHRPEIGRAADELARSAMTGTAAIAGSEYWWRLRARVRGLAAVGVREELVASMDVLERDHGTTALTFGASHGDWAPWNMTLIDSRAHVWDWEKYSLGLPVGVDSAHFFVNHAVAVGRTRPREAFAELVRTAPDALAAHGLSRSAAGLTAWVYVLEIAVRYLEDRETAMGSTPLTRLSDWLPPTLAALRSQAASRPS